MNSITAEDNLYDHGYSYQLLVEIKFLRWFSLLYISVLMLSVYHGFLVITLSSFLYNKMIHIFFSYFRSLVIYGRTDSISGVLEIEKKIINHLTISNAHITQDITTGGHLIEFHLIESLDRNFLIK
jgi:hypothetical protein